MELKITLRNNKEVIVPNCAVNPERFMEELALITSGFFVQKTKYIRKCGDFIDIHGVYIRYSEIYVIEKN